MDLTDNSGFVSHHTRYDPKSHQAKVLAGQAVAADADVDALKEVLEMVGFEVPDETPSVARRHRRPHEAT